MNIKEQIRAEIDARRQNMVYELYGLLDDSEKYICVKGMHDAYVDMLTYIDFLPEQPASEGLEEFRKEVIKFSQDHFDELHSDMDTIDIVHIIARHFAEWQKKRDDLETADLLAIAHLQGMEQQKSKMLEDAVEGVAEELYNDGESQCTVGVGTYFKPGEEVYVIKKEEQE